MRSSSTAARTQYSSCASLLDRATTGARGGALAARQQPCLHVAIVSALSVRDRQQQPFATVEKSGPQDIGAHKRPKPVQKAACERHPPPRSHHLLSARAGIAIDARERVLDAIDGIVQERLLEAQH